ncbi:MAG TPA: DUF2950 domain-containing protein [Phycisphaerae bacterium]|nr:DUF2950 domain-containing protein [Phycisphaerae bacterium]
MCLPIFQKHPLLLLFVFLLSSFSAGCASQKTFSDPDLAVDALVSSFRTNDQDQTRRILGPAGDELLFSGDPVEVQTGLQKFLHAYDEKHELSANDDGTVTLSVGDDEWPMPIPLAKNDKNAWYFDTEAGKDEILNRRIGRNELDTIQTMLAINDAQREYAETDPDHDGVPAYAQKFLSDPGKKNGLYWQTKEGEPDSPLGPLVATAASQGYTHATNDEPQPYRGYFYHMLTAQGPSAPGGARDYIVNGQMLGGFAVVAYPATYGNSGIMTFIINQDGTVYQRDLGEDTAKLAIQITTFDPDDNWKKVDAKDETPPTTQPAN